MIILRNGEVRSVESWNGGEPLGANDNRGALSQGGSSERRQMRALVRALDVLCVVSRGQSRRILELCDELDLPPTTVGRLLRALKSCGLVVRDARERRYRAILQLGVTSPWSSQPLPRRALQGPLDQVAARLGGVVELSTPLGQCMVVRMRSIEASTARERGVEQPIEVLRSIGTSAEGMVCLAQLSPEAVETCLSAQELRPSREQPRHRTLEDQRGAILKVRAEGYVQRFDAGSREHVLAVPVRQQGRYVASLVLRMRCSHAEAQRQFHSSLQTLRELAQQVSEFSVD